MTGEEPVKEAKKDDGGDGWLKILALTTVLFAVGATLSTFKGGGYSTKAVLSQNQASDQWAFYQAKSIKSNLYELEVEHLKRDLDTLNGVKDGDDPKGQSQEVGSTQRAIAEAEKRLAKYEHEKQEIQKAARGFEANREDAMRHSRPFGLAVIFLQIAVVISSIAALMKNKFVYWASLAVGLVGIAFFLNGFFLLF